MTDDPLPPSLAVTPNIAPKNQTLDQLYAERDYWDNRIKSATGWGAAVGAADDFRRACETWIAIREKESAS